MDYPKVIFKLPFPSLSESNFILQVEEELILSTQVDHSLKIEDSTNNSSRSLTVSPTNVPSTSTDKENNNPGNLKPSAVLRRQTPKQRKKMENKVSKKKSPTDSSNSSELACTYCNMSFNDKVEFQV